MRARFPVLAAFILLFLCQPGAVCQSESRCGFVDAEGRLHAAVKTKDRRFSLESGAWAAASVSLENTWHFLDENPGRKGCFYSPDKKVLTEIDGKNVTLVADGRRIATEFGKLTNAELGWSPDSKRFFVTWTDGGETGQWHTDVYEVTESTIRKFADKTEMARLDFEKRIRQLPSGPIQGTKSDRLMWEGAVYCEPYNVVGAQWLKGSKELLVSVLVPNTSACRYEAEFNVYRIEVETGKVLRRYTAEEAHRHYNSKNLPLTVN